MISSLIILHMLSFVILKAFGTPPNAFFTSEYVESFLNNFFNLKVANKKSTSSLDFTYKLSDEELAIIYINSFKEDNLLGNYESCKLFDYSYIYFVYLDLNDYNDAVNKNLAINLNDIRSYNLYSYYQELMFYNYISFSMCLPSIINDFSFLNRTTIEAKDDPFRKYFQRRQTSYFVNIYNITNIEQTRNSQMNGELLATIILWMLIFSFSFSLVISLISSYRDLTNAYINFIKAFSSFTRCIICCSKKKSKSKPERDNGSESSLIEEEYMGEISKRKLSENNTLKCSFIEQSLNRSNLSSQNLRKSIIEAETSNEHLHLASIEELQDEYKSISINFDNSQKYFLELMFEYLKFVYDLKENFCRITSSHNPVSDSWTADHYVNDNDFRFINGIRGILVLSLLFSLVLWYTLETPNSLLNREDSTEIFLQHSKFLCAIYWAAWSIIINTSVNSFLLGFKFLTFYEKYYAVYRSKYATASTPNSSGESLRSSDSSKRNDLGLKINTIISFKIVFRFICLQSYQYLVYIFIFYFIYSIDWIFTSNQAGPFLYLYEEQKNAAMDNQLSFLFGYANFLVNFALEQEDEMKRLVYYFFLIIFLNEIYFTIYGMILLILYRMKKLIMLLVILSLYIGSIIFRTIYLDIKSLYLKTVIGFDILNTSPIIFLSVFHLGLFFGIIMYEYYKSQINDHDEEKDEFVDYLVNENVEEITLPENNHPGYLTMKMHVRKTYESFPSKDNKKKNDYNSSKALTSDKTKSKSSKPMGKASSKHSKKNKKSDTQKIHSFIKKYFVDKKNRYIMMIPLGMLTTLLIACIFIDSNQFLVRVEEMFNRSEFVFEFKAYWFFELEILELLMFLIIFKNIIFKKSMLSSFLEKKTWIILSRCSSIIKYLAIPITNVILFNSSNMINFNFYCAILILFTVIFLLSIMSITILLLIDIPLKLTLRKIINQAFESSKRTLE